MIQGPLRSRPISRRDPAPFDLVIYDGNLYYGLMLATVGPGGQLIKSKRLPIASANPTDFSYTSQSPQYAQTFAQHSFTGGYGQRYIRNHEDDLTRYYWAIAVDCACEAGAILGPLITIVTPDASLDTTNGISHFWVQSVSSTDTLFALNGRYALVRNGGDAASNWDESKDFGVGKIAKDVIVHAQNTGTGGTDYAYVAMGDADNFWYYDATSITTTWTQHATLKALCWAKSGKHFFRAYSQNIVARVSANSDPLVAGNWADIARIGDATSVIVRMLVHPDGTLYIFKTDGIYVLLDDGTDVQLYGSLGFTPNSKNGRYNFPFENWIHTTYANQHYRIGPGAAIEPIGPERMTENASDVRGRITAGVATPWGIVCGIQNDDDNVSHTLKYGSWRTGDDGISHRMDAWHGSISPQYTSEITAVSRSAVGAATNHDRVYIGFANGNIGYYLLNCSPNPKACSSYRYNATAINGTIRGYLYTSNYDGHYAVDDKHLLWVANTMNDGNASSGITIGSIGYSKDSLLGTGTGGTGATAAWGGTTTGLAAAEPPGQHVDVTDNIIFTTMAWEWAFRNVGTDTASPSMTSWGMNYTANPLMTLLFEFVVLAEDGLKDRDGKPLALGKDAIKTLMRRFSRFSGDYQVRFPDGSDQYRVWVNEYEETFVWDTRGDGGWKDAVRVVVMQTQPAVANYSGGTRKLGSSS